MSAEERGGRVPGPIIASADQGDFRKIAGLIRSSIPNALVSHLGLQFGSAYYATMVARPGSCGFVARDAVGRVIGVSIGSLDSVGLQRDLLRSQIVTLLLAANVRLLRPAVLWWLTQGIRARLDGSKSVVSDDATGVERPRAELLAVAVAPEHRRSGLSSNLVECFEDVLRMHASGPKEYCIHTEASNVVANRFYRRIGAELALTSRHHGREINQWRKRL